MKRSDAFKISCLFAVFAMVLFGMTGMTLAEEVTIGLDDMVIAPAINTDDSSAQKIVISVKQNLFNEKGYESACVAGALGTLLSKNGAEVTIFASLEGVSIANAEQMFLVDAYAAYIGKYKCMTNIGLISLGDVVKGFIGSGGKIIICPLCWTTRFSMEPKAEEFTSGAFMGDADSMAEVFMEADKIIDF